MRNFIPLLVEGLDNLKYGRGKIPTIINNNNYKKVNPTRTS